MTNKIFVAGGGSLASVLADSLKFLGQYEVSAFFDLVGGGHKYGSKMPSYDIQDTHLVNAMVQLYPFVLGVFKPEYRMNFVMLVGENNFTRILDGNIAEHASIGKGSVVMHGAYLMYNATVKDFVHVHTGTIIGHDVVVDSYTAFAPGCIVGGGTKIGMGCSFGMGARILPKINIADGVTVGAGAVVTKDIMTPNVTVVGCPARIKK